MNLKSFNLNIQDLPLLAVLFVIAACQSEADKSLTSAPNKFSDTTLIKIYEYQDRRDTDALTDFLNDDSPIYRAAAAEAFGSVQDSLAIPLLANLLGDENTKVRKAAAYALGQTYDSSAIKPLAMALDTEDSLFVRRELLESLGKVVTQDKLEWLYRQPTPDKLEKEGLAWGLYRAGLRNVIDDLSTATAVTLLDSKNNYLTRLGAAHYLSRTRNLNIDQFLPQLIKAATQDSAANVRMAATSALGKINLPGSYKVLAGQCAKDNDYRVRVNALRSLSSANFDRSKEVYFEALADTNVNVCITAASVIANQSSDSDFLLEEAARHDDGRVSALLYKGALSVAEDKDDVSDHIKQAFLNAEDPYYKSALLEALSASFKNYEFIITQAFEANHPAISTAAANALVTMRKDQNFPQDLESAFADVFREMILTTDIGMVYTVSQILTDSAYNFKAQYESYDFLRQAKSKLSLPKDNEALQQLNRAIAYFEGDEEMPETTNEFNHPINWELVESIAKGQKVRIKTKRGFVDLELLVEEAPGSAANFITLINQNYFTGKNFHRVVPNFVIQGGCNRGDGFGSEDYSIRSEFANLRYQTGTVGMASAGKDTEGTQWFITHSPTPHLDGKYTIFAQVINGMEVVHNTQVGDKILEVKLIN